MGIVVTTDVKEKNRYSPVFRTHKSANRLTHIYDADTNLVAHYQYDPFGRRISKQVGTNTTYYLYSDEGLIAEYDEAGNEVQSYGYAPNSLWMNNPLYTRTESHTSTNKAYYYYLNDHLGAPQKLMAKNGEIVWSGVSESFGQITVTIETIKNNLRFSSQYYDEESGLHQNFFRYFDPKIGRYTKRDPLGERGGVNLYRFVGNSPSLYIDIAGLDRLIMEATFVDVNHEIRMINTGAFFIEEDFFTFDDVVYIPGKFEFNGDKVYFNRGGIISASELVNMADKGGYEKSSEWEGAIQKLSKQAPLKVKMLEHYVQLLDDPYYLADVRSHGRELLHSTLDLYSSAISGAVFGALPIKGGLPVQVAYAVYDGATTTGVLVSDPKTRNPASQDSDCYETINDFRKILEERGWYNIKPLNDNAISAQYEVFNDWF